jgi:hypothetical protein
MMDMQMSHLDGLFVPAPVLVQCLDQLELQAQQSSAVAWICRQSALSHFGCPMWDGWDRRDNVG